MPLLAVYMTILDLVRYSSQRFPGLAAATTVKLVAGQAGPLIP